MNLKKYQPIAQTVGQKFIAILLLVAIVLSILPHAAFAAPTQQYGSTHKQKPTQHPPKAEYAEPVYEYPTIKTRWRSNVRKGPHKQAALVTVLPAHYTARITGRNIKATWWEIETIEQYPKKLGWIAKHIVYTYGDVSKVSFSGPSQAGHLRQACLSLPRAWYSLSHPGESRTPLRVDPYRSHHGQRLVASTVGA